MAFSVRQPRDAAGRFAEVQRGAPASDVLGSVGAGDSTVERLGRDTDGLWGLVDSPDVVDQVVASRALALSAEQAQVLGDAGCPFAARFALAGRADGLGDGVASVDPDPVVRARVLQSSTGLAGDVRRRLSADPDVGRVWEVLGWSHVDG